MSKVTGISVFKDIQYPLIVIPFNGVMVSVVLRELNQIQLESCGDFSLIEIEGDRLRAKKKTSIPDMVKYAKTMSEIARASLVKPTYDEIMSIFDADDTLKGFDKKLSDLKELLNQTPGGRERKSLEEQIAFTEIWCNQILPTDFLSAITTYATGIDKSNIRLVTEKILLDCAILSKQCNNSPADHIDGIFTPFMKKDINRRALNVLHEWRETETRKNRRAREAQVRVG